MDYLYAYLQSVNLSDAEVNSIVANAKEVSTMLNQAFLHLRNCQMQTVQRVGRLFLDSAQKAHLNVAFVDKNGNALSFQA